MSGMVKVPVATTLAVALPEMKKYRYGMELSAGVVAAGGLIGSWLGAARFSILDLRRALALVLVLAAAKLVFLP